MSQVSRPMQIALAATVALALVWLVALRPKSSSVEEAAPPAPAPAQSAPASDGGAAPGTAGLAGAVDAAKGAVGTADADARRAQQSSADGADPAGGASAPARATSPSDAPGAKQDPAGRGASTGDAGGHAAGAQVHTVKAALRHHKAVALAFVDPHTADARAVAREVRSVSRFGGRAVALAVPLARLSDFSFITSTVEVTVAPTVVIVDRRRRATTIVGFADRGEIEQRLADALAVKRRG